MRKGYVSNATSFLSMNLSLLQQDATRFPGYSQLTRPQYHPVRPSIPSPFVQIAIVIAQAMKMMNACVKCRMFFVRPRLPPEGRGIWNFMLCKGGVFQPCTSSCSRDG